MASIHGQYLGQTKEVRKGQSWVWLQNGDLNRKVESLTVAPQDLSIRKNLVQVKNDKTQKDILCRLRKKADERIDHVVSGCSKLAQKA